MRALPAAVLRYGRIPVIAHCIGSGGAVQESPLPGDLPEGAATAIRRSPFCFAAGAVD
jgi:hypothetical protein